MRTGCLGVTSVATPSGLAGRGSARTFSLPGGSDGLAAGGVGVADRGVMPDVDRSGGGLDPESSWDCCAPAVSRGYDGMTSGDAASLGGAGFTVAGLDRTGIPGRPSTWSHVRAAPPRTSAARLASAQRDFH